VNIHKNARLTITGRRGVAAAVLGGRPASDVAQGAGCSVRTVWKWVARYRAGGESALADRSSRPHRLGTRLPRYRHRQILRARHRRWSTTRIAQETGVALSTVIHLVRRHGLQRLPRLEPPREVRRYEMSAPGELLHVDTKKLGRFYQPGHRVTGDRSDRRTERSKGWEFLHVAIDDRTRLAYAELLLDEKGATCAGFLERAAAFYSRHGIRRLERVMSDNGSPYISGKFRGAVAALGARHIRTRPYTPRTNGKAERFIQTALREWAYHRPYYTSAERARCLTGWIDHYNCARPHGSLAAQPPMSRFPGGNNLMLVHT